MNVFIRITIALATVVVVASAINPCIVKVKRSYVSKETVDLPSKVIGSF